MLLTDVVTSDMMHHDVTSDMMHPYESNQVCQALRIYLGWLCLEDEKENTSMTPVPASFEAIQVIT